MVDYFESPGAAGFEGHHVCCVLRTMGFLRLAWVVLTRSTLITGYWRRTHNAVRADDPRPAWPWHTECRCHGERLPAETLKDVMFIDISRDGSCEFNPRNVGIIWNGAS
jgi:hypothetical protein